MSMYFSLLFLFFDVLIETIKTKIACTFPCSSCENEDTNCLSCVESYSLNWTNCISNEECLLDGYIENGICYGCNLISHFILIFILLKKKKKKKK